MNQRRQTSAATATPQQSWFASAPESQKPMLDALRALVLATAPGIVEEIKWSRPCYSTDRGLFCYLHSTKHHVTLGFQRGASLDDPKGLLVGTGKDMRHVKVVGMDDIDAPAIRRLLQQAIELP